MLEQVLVGAEELGLGGRALIEDALVARGGPIVLLVAEAPVVDGQPLLLGLAHDRVALRRQLHLARLEVLDLRAGQIDAASQIRIELERSRLLELQLADQDLPAAAHGELRLLAVLAGEAHEHLALLDVRPAGDVGGDQAGARPHREQILSGEERLLLGQMTGREAVDEPRRAERERGPDPDAEGEGRRLLGQPADLGLPDQPHHLAVAERGEQESDQRADDDDCGEVSISHRSLGYPSKGGSPLRQNS